jgi:hypothetical protein
VEVRDVSLVHNYPERLWEPASLLLRRYQCCDGHSGRGVKLTTHIFQAPKLRMSGAIPLLPLHDFVAYKRTTFKDLYGNAMRGGEAFYVYLTHPSSAMNL